MEAGSGESGIYPGAVRIGRMGIDAGLVDVGVFRSAAEGNGPILCEVNIVIEGHRGGAYIAAGAVGYGNIAPAGYLDVLLGNPGYVGNVGTIRSRISAALHIGNLLVPVIKPFLCQGNLISGRGGNGNTVTGNLCAVIGCRIFERSAFQTFQVLREPDINLIIAYNGADIGFAGEIRLRKGLHGCITGIGTGRVPCAGNGQGFVQKFGSRTGLTICTIGGGHAVRLEITYSSQHGILPLGHVHGIRIINTCRNAGQLSCTGIGRGCICTNGNNT